MLLPRGVGLGSVVDIRVTRNETQEQRKREEFITLQDEILQKYGVTSPSPPVIHQSGVTQTTVTIGWEPLDLANADLLSLDVLRNGERIAKIPRARSSTSTKLSGLAMDTEYSIQLVMSTSAGLFASNELLIKTHTLDDLSGIFVCLGCIPDARLCEATKKVVEALGARWSNQIQLETTHLVCSVSPGPTEEQQMKLYEKAEQLTLPIIQPHWLFACSDKKRMLSISPFYLDCMPPNALEVQEQISRMQEQSENTQRPVSDTADTADVRPHANVEESPNNGQVNAGLPVIPASDREVLDVHEKSAPAMLNDDTIDVWASTEPAKQRSPRNASIAAENPQSDALMAQNVWDETSTQNEHERAPVDEMRPEPTMLETDEAKMQESEAKKQSTQTPASTREGPEEELINDKAYPVDSGFHQFVEQEPESKKPTPDDESAVKGNQPVTEETQTQHTDKEALTDNTPERKTEADMENIDLNDS